MGGGNASHVLHGLGGHRPQGAYNLGTQRSSSRQHAVRRAQWRHAAVWSTHVRHGGEMKLVESMSISRHRLFTYARPGAVWWRRGLGNAWIPRYMAAERQAVGYLAWPRTLLCPLLKGGEARMVAGCWPSFSITTWPIRERLRATAGTQASGGEGAGRRLRASTTSAALPPSVHSNAILASIMAAPSPNKSNTSRAPQIRRSNRRPRRIKEAGVVLRWVRLRA